MRRLVVIFDVPTRLCSRYIPNTYGLAGVHPFSIRRTRSRRPWRTLFERVLGSLQYGAVLSLAETSENRSTGEGKGSHSTTAAAAGKVVWANEGFEKLAGVDAVDIVGQDIVSVFAEGGEEEEGDGEEDGELKRSLELGTVSLAQAAKGSRHCLAKECPISRPAKFPRIHPRIYWAGLGSSWGALIDATGF